MLLAYDARERPVCSMLEASIVRSTREIKCSIKRNVMALKRKYVVRK